MFIYEFNKDNNTFVKKFNVKKQFCTQCLLQIVNNNNCLNSLDKQTKDFVCEYKNAINKCIKISDTVFMTTNNCLLAISNIENLKHNSFLLQNSIQFINNGNLPHINGISNIYTNFHNHQNCKYSDICLHFNSNNIVFGVYNTAKYYLFANF